MCRTTTKVVLMFQVPILFRFETNLKLIILLICYRQKHVKNFTFILQNCNLENVSTSSINKTLITLE